MHIKSGRYFFDLGVIRASVKGELLCKKDHGGIRAGVRWTDTVLYHVQMQELYILAR